MVRWFKVLEEFGGFDAKVGIECVFGITVENFSLQDKISPG